MTSTKLIFYWYVHNKPWNPLYDIHTRMLKEYKDRFTEQEFIIATDPDTQQEYIDNVKARLNEIFPDAVFTPYGNDKQLRESLYFYNEIATKLDSLEDRWYFFAHNKGVDTWYAPGDICKMWIIGMYYMNLNYPDRIQEQMESPDTCVIGTYLIRNQRAWPWLTYQWHFSGTYWWLNPKRIASVMRERNTAIPPRNDRYFTEGCWGTCLPDEEKYRKPALGNYSAHWKNNFNWMNPEDKERAMKFLNPEQQ